MPGSRDPASPRSRRIRSRRGRAHALVLAAGALAAAALALLAPAAPAAAADAIDGLTAAQAAALSQVKVALFLPKRLPSGFRPYAVDAYPDAYHVLYSDGLRSLVVETERDGDLAGLANAFEAVGPERASAAFGRFRAARGALEKYDRGCFSHAPLAFAVRGTKYRFVTCGSLTSEQLADVVASAARVTTIRAARTDADEPLAPGLTPEQQRRLRALPMPVVAFATLPDGYRARDVRTTGTRHRADYTVDYGDGHGTFRLTGSDWGFGDGDAPVRRLAVPVHSALFGDVTLVVDPQDPDCIVGEALLTISLAPGYSVRGCKMSPYVMKRIIESARLLRPL